MAKQQRQKGTVSASRAVLGREDHDRLTHQLPPESGGKVLSLLSGRHDNDRPPGARQTGLHRTGQAFLPRRDHGT